VGAAVGVSGVTEGRLRVMTKGSNVIAEPRPFLHRFRAGMAFLARLIFSARVAPPIDPPPPIVFAAREPKRNSDPGGPGAAVITRTRVQVKKPNMYRVLLLNDDYTPMDFVVSILQTFFNKSVEQATEIMLHVHRNGVGECGVFTYEVAETKVAQVMDHARKNQHPLQCIMEKK